MICGATVPCPLHRLAPRQELREKLEIIPGVAIPEERLDKRPGFALSLLEDDTAFARFTGAMDWVFEQWRAASGA